MTLKELYQNMKNPLTKDAIIKIIEKMKDTPNVYHAILQMEQKENKYLHKKDMDEFYSFLFNKWKNSILRIGKNNYKYLETHESIEKDIFILQDFLEKTQDFISKEDAEKKLNVEDNRLQKIIDKYRWDSFGFGSGWTHDASRYLTAKEDAFPDVKHRLYLNFDSLDLYKMLNLFVKECESEKVPYYFKFSPNRKRDDSLVIYSDTKNITKYVEILKNIKKKNPELIKKAKNPPILTGKIDSFIGYGSEPEIVQGKRNSYNNVRAGIIEESIYSEATKWMMDKMDLSNIKDKKEYINNAIKNDLGVLVKNDNKLLDNILNSINKNCIQYGIDEKTFCFDILTKREMIYYYNKEIEKQRENKDYNKER